MIKNKYFDFMNRNNLKAGLVREFLFKEKYKAAAACIKEEIDKLERVKEKYKQLLKMLSNDNHYEQN